MTEEMSEYPSASLNLGRNGSREKLVPIYGDGLDLLLYFWLYQEIVISQF